METLEYKLLPAIDFFIEPDCVTGKRRELRCRRAMRGDRFRLPILPNEGIGKNYLRG